MRLWPKIEKQVPLKGQAYCTVVNEVMKINSRSENVVFNHLEDFSSRWLIAKCERCENLWMTECAMSSFSFIYSKKLGQALHAST